MKKRLLSILLCLAMLLTLLPAAALAFEAPAIARPDRNVTSTKNPDPGDTIWVSGVELEEGEYLASGSTEPTTVPPEDNYVSWSGDNILYMKNYISSEGAYYYSPNDNSVIYCEQNFLIHAVGTNTLLNPNDDGDGITAYYCDVTIVGGGTLNIDAAYGIIAWGGVYEDGSFCGSVNIDDVTLNISSNYKNISADGSLAIANSTVKAMCARDTCLSVYEGDTILNDSDITLYQHDSGEAESESYCLTIAGEVDLSIDGCTLDFSGADCAIATSGGDITMKDTKALIYASQIGIIANADVIIENSTAGIFAGSIALGTPDGDIILKGSTEIIYPIDGTVGTATYSEEDFRIVLTTVVNDAGYGCPYVGFGAKFTDVVPGTYYEEPVYFALLNGITAGTSATTFSPNKACTRAEIVSFLHRAMGESLPENTTSPFTDVAPGAYFYNAVLFAWEEGITAGTSATTFSPNKACTRAEVVTFLWRANGKPQPESSTCPFTDANPNSYYYTAMLWAAENGITAGTSATTFSPDKTCTRAEVVSFLYRLMV